MAKSTIGSLFFLAFSIFYFINVFSIKKMPGGHYEVMTASTFPYYIGLAGIIISSIILLFSFIEKDEDVLSLSYLKTLDFKTTTYFVGAMLFYGYTIRSLGFIIATIIFLLIGFVLLKERNVKRILLISVSVSVGFYILLNNVLGVYIEPGIIADYFAGDQS
ncbi:MAG: tripartite tricarboxylate transporter TctB family protein [Campylobacteraceae bacterium]|nr:tripartite tricarboxylate transporter TctB family protein [Campylobacteraceae bacterium]